jgi:hypothetical protein
MRIDRVHALLPVALRNFVEAIEERNDEVMTDEILGCGARDLIVSRELSS